MINNISMNSAQFLQLDTDIRTTSTSTFNAQDAYENTFEDVVSEIVNKTQEEERNNKINFSNLGAPAGFFLDTSLLDEINNGAVEQKAPINPYSLLD